MGSQTGVDDALSVELRRKRPSRVVGGWWSPYNLGVTAQSVLTGQQWEGVVDGDPSSGDQGQPGADGGDGGGYGGMTA